MDDYMQLFVSKWTIMLEISKGSGFPYNKHMSRKMQITIIQLLIYMMPQIKKRANSYYDLF